MLGFAENLVETFRAEFAEGHNPELLSADAALHFAHRIKRPASPPWLLTAPGRILDYECVRKCWWTSESGDRQGYRVEVLTAIMDIAGVIWEDPASAVPPPLQEPCPLQRQGSAKRRGRPIARRASGHHKGLDSHRRKSDVRDNRIESLKKEIHGLGERIKALSLKSGGERSVPESMDIALRAAMSNQSANSIGMGLKINISHQTCLRYETRLHAALVAYVRQCYAELGKAAWDHEVPSVKSPLKKTFLGRRVQCTGNVFA